VDFYHFLGYFTDFLLITPEMEPQRRCCARQLWCTFSMPLFALLSPMTGTPKAFWAISGLIFGFWASNFVLLPEKKPTNR
jgi:hypothetical protein